jgi:hypothetical protein
MRFATTAASLITLLANASLALALAPLGPAFQVNSTTAGSQGYGGYTSCGYWKQRQHGIGSGGGQFVVVWESRNYPEYGVFGQRYDSTATPLGGEFEVHTSSMGTQTMPVVAQSASGQFVVAWGSSQFYGYPMDIFAGPSTRAVRRSGRRSRYRRTATSSVATPPITTARRTIRRSRPTRAGSSSSSGRARMPPRTGRTSWAAAWMPRVRRSRARSR